MKNIKFGWKRDRPDHRDYQFKLEKKAGKLKSVYLFDSKNTPPVYDQDNLGSCTGNGVAAVSQTILMNKTPGLKDPTAELFYPSRLFIYYYARLCEGNASEDAGASIRDAVKVIVERGVCSEKKWPYDITKFAVEPPKDAQDQALRFEALEYQRIDNSKKSNIVGALLQGHPIVFGFDVFESFIQAETTGVVPYPDPSEIYLGGHCCVIWAYNAQGDYFLCRNSWGTAWGKNGYFQIPAKYLTNPALAGDFWIIKSLK